MRTVRTVKRFGRRQWLVIGALLFVLAFTAFFAFRAAKGILYWDARQEMGIKRWMSIPYIAKTRNVPESVLNQAIGLPAGVHDPRPLARIAKEQNNSVHELQDKIASTIAEHNALNPVAEGTP